MFFDGQKMEVTKLKFQIEIYDYSGRWIPIFGPATDGTKNYLIINNNDKETKYQFLIESDYNYGWLRRKLQYWQKMHKNFESRYTLMNIG